MVNMNYQTTTDSLSVRQKLTQLMNQRTELESELKAYLDILSANHVGMQDPLVDSEGYPRQDVDVYQVRNARNRVLCIQNDLRALMQEIEVNLHLVHSIDGASSQPTQVTTQQPIIFNPIARIGDIVPNSPAERAGLAKDDIILEFGPINASNFRNLQDIAATVRAGVHTDIPLLVLKSGGGTRQRLLLKPQPFDGQGLVGCYFLNVENVER